MLLVEFTINGLVFNSFVVVKLEIFSRDVYRTSVRANKYYRVTVLLNETRRTRVEKLSQPVVITAPRGTVKN